MLLSLTWSSTTSSGGLVLCDYYSQVWLLINQLSIDHRQLVLLGILYPPRGIKITPPMFQVFHISPWPKLHEGIITKMTKWTSNLGEAWSKKRINTQSMNEISPLLEEARMIATLSNSSATKNSTYAPLLQKSTHKCPLLWKSNTNSQ